MKKNKLISALIICYNEERVIERCLTSLSGVVDEIIVIHDGKCNDDTLKIARKYTNKVYEQKEHKGMCEAWYLFGFSVCASEWILKLDADEFLSSELSNNLKAICNRNTANAFSFIWEIWDGKEYITHNWPYKMFLFRKSKICFLDKYHYPIKVQGETKKIPLRIEHMPLYNNYSKDTFNKKTVKWIKLQARDHLEPVGNRAKLNLSEADLNRETKIKDIIYYYPLLTGILAMLALLPELVKKPVLFFQKGFWVIVFFNFKYSYNVAKEVNNLKLSSKKIKI